HDRDSTLGPPHRVHVRTCRAPGGLPAPGARLASLAVDSLGLLFRRQLGRQIDRTGEIGTALDGMWIAGHGIFEDWPLEDLLCRWLAARGSCDRPLHGQANIVVFG